MTDDIKISDAELGVWFGIDGEAIKTQPQLDLAVIALAELHGFEMPKGIDLEGLHKLVHETDEDSLCPTIVSELIWQCELATRYLNGLVNDKGFRFTFTGEHYDRLVLVRAA